MTIVEIWWNWVNKPHFHLCILTNTWFNSVNHDHMLQIFPSEVAVNRCNCHKIDFRLLKCWHTTEWRPWYRAKETQNPLNWLQNCKELLFAHCSQPTTRDCYTCGTSSYSTNCPSYHPNKQSLGRQSGCKVCVKVRTIGGNASKNMKYWLGKHSLISWIMNIWGWNYLDWAEVEKRGKNTFYFSGL